MAISYGAYPDERALVLACQGGEDAAFASLYDAYFPRIFRYVSASVGRRHDAEDVTAEVFVKAFLNIGTYRDQSKPVGAWLFRIARNEVVDFYRRQGRRVDAAPADLQQTAAGQRSDPLGVTDVLMDLASALRGLPAPQRDAFLLRMVEGLSTRQTAAIMKVPEGTMRSHLHYAIRSLRKALGEHT